MSAPVNDRRTELTVGAGPQVTFTYDFNIETVDDIRVYVTPLATGIPVEIDTRVSSSSPAEGEFYVDPAIASVLEVTLNVSDVTVGDAVILEGDRATNTLTSFTTTGDFNASTVNAEYKNLRRMVEENARDIDRSLSRNPGHTGAFDMELPATLPIGHAIIIDSAGTGLSTLDVASENAAIVANTTHRGSDGKDHSDVVTNTADIATNVTNIATNTADIASHSGSDGTSHTYIDQDVTTSGTPTFASVTTTGDGTFSGNVVAGSSTGAPTEASADNLIVGSVITSNNGLSILSINTSNICFSDAADGDVGRIRYTHGATNSMEFRVAAQAALTLNSGLDATFADDVEVGGDLTQNVATGHVRHTIDTDSGVGDRAELYMHSGSETAFLDLQENASRFRVATNTVGAVLSLRAGTNDENLVLSGEAGAELASFAGDVEVGGDLTLGASGVDTTWESPLLTPSNVVGGQGLIAAANNPPSLIAKHTYASNRREIIRATCDGGAITRFVTILSLPNSYDGRAVNFDLYFTQSSTNTGDVNLGIQMSSNEDGDDLTDTNLGSQDVNYTVSGVVDELQTWSSSVTPYGGADSPSQLMIGNMYRNGSTGSDTYADDIYIIGIKFYL
jgi:hypothetical protein